MFGLNFNTSFSYCIQVGTPAALAVTGENGGDDLATTLVSGGIVAFFYFLVVPVSRLDSPSN